MKKFLLIFLLFPFALETGSKCLEFEYELENTIESVVMYDDVVGTVYHPTKKQCDGTPFLTADHSIIKYDKILELRWVALSRDLIYHKGDTTKNDFRNWNGKISFGDTIIIESPHSEINGKWVVHDTMNKRYTKHIDFLQTPNGLYGKWEDITIKKKQIVEKIVNKRFDHSFYEMTKNFKKL